MTSPLEPVEILNVRITEMQPNPDTYLVRDFGLSNLEDTGTYDFTMDADVNLDEVLESFRWKWDTVAQTHQATGRLEAWKELHRLLSTGTSFTGSKAISTRTSLKLGAVVVDPKKAWSALWNHTLSTSLDAEDLIASSADPVKISLRTAHHTNLGPSYDPTKEDQGLAAAILAGFYNDITGPLNDMIGGMKTEIVAGSIAAWEPRSPTEVVVAPTEAHTDYLPSLALFLYRSRKLQAFSGDIADTYQSLRFLDGDSLSFRLNCTVITGQTVKIRITHKPGAPTAPP